ncbi:major capsid protein [Microviridae sp.]|nr:major capsid protein [Microviridae sp.]
MKRYKHNLSHQRLLTCDMGQLIPISTVEVLPGDTVQHNTNALIRVSPLAAPVMHSVTARIHHFFVPNRLVWDSWEDFITGGADGFNSDTVPQVTITSDPPGPLPDYMGVPLVEGLDINAMPIRAFNLIYNEFYRDQDLASVRAEDDMTIPQIAWEKDYFTTCRPWTQKGPDVTVPLGDTAPIIPNTGPPSYTNDNNQNATAFGAGTGGSSGLVSHAAPTEGSDFYWSDPNLIADLSAAVGGDINDIRKAFAIQRYQEARARYGSRYTEYLRYLGVTPADSRLQRPEFLGGGSTQLNFSEIMQSANGTDPRFGVGDLYGHGIGAMRSNRYRRHIEEHGFIISLLSVRPKTVYNQAVNRKWLRTDKEDYFQKELAQIGQQAVQNVEVYGPDDDRDTTFGYQDRYAEYREEWSGVSAEFRDTLNYWHMARDFTAQPVLNQSFTDCIPTKRIHNEQTANALWVTAQHKMVARRIVPRNAAPRIL